MKTINKFVVAAVVATLSTIGVNKAAASPRGDEQHQTVATASSEGDADTVHGRPLLGKATPQDVVVSEPEQSETDTVNATRESSPEVKSEAPAATPRPAHKSLKVKDADTNIVSEETMPEDEQFESADSPQ